MKNSINIALIVGFLAADFFFFHDIFKAGEVISLAQYLTGILSIVVIAQAITALASTNQTTAI